MLEPQLLGKRGETRVVWLQSPQPWKIYSLEKRIDTVLSAPESTENKIQRRAGAQRSEGNVRSNKERSGHIVGEM